MSDQIGDEVHVYHNGEFIGSGSLSKLPVAKGFPPMPPNVAKALTQVMAGAKKLGRDESNPFAHYKYAGIDAFLEMLGPLCAEAGLQVYQDELDYEFREAADKSGKVLTWLVQTWAFGLGHESGEVYPYKFKRTSMVQASMGSQALGAGQSYALKSFLRSIGLIATGEAEDADAHEQRELPAIAKKKTKAESRPTYTELESGIRNCTSKAELELWAHEHADDLQNVSEDWHKNLRIDYARHLASLA